MWSDRESEVDYLNFGEISQVAADILTSPNMLPVSIGVFGNWGAGKSSLLKLIEKELKTRQKEKVDEKEYLVVNFDAWLYQGYDDARAALLEVIATKLSEAAKGNRTLLDKTKSLLSRVDMFRAMGLVAETAVLAMGVPTGGLASRIVKSSKDVYEALTDKDKELSDKEIKEAKKTLEDAQKEASKLIKPADKKTPPEQIDAFRREYSQILEELKKPLIVFIDNLDRCLPTKAIHTLEAIRLFLFLPNTGFVIAADEEMIRGSVAEHFKHTSNQHQIDYLDKLIQMPIRVPKTGIREITAYLFMLFAVNHNVEKEKLDKLREYLEKSLQQSWKDELIDKNKAIEIVGTDNDDLINAFDLAQRISPLLSIAPKIHGNPRIVKRLLNEIKIRKNIASRQKMDLHEGIITKLVIFERCAGPTAARDLYGKIQKESGKPEIITALEEDSDDYGLPSNSPESWSRSSSFIKDWSKLEPKLSGIDLRPAAYLSRATMAIGSYVSGLSLEGRDAVEVLSILDLTGSQEAEKVLKNLPQEEEIVVMEEIINNLRQVNNWRSRPPGFVGACLLAEHSKEAGKIFRRYIKSMQKNPRWMNPTIKDYSWYQE